MPLHHNIHAFFVRHMPGKRRFRAIRPIACNFLADVFNHRRQVQSHEARDDKTDTHWYFCWQSDSPHSLHVASFEMLAEAALTRIGLRPSEELW